jgi:hypothetical protein
MFSRADERGRRGGVCGTEPSRLFRSDDRGEGWRALDALLELPLASHLELPAPAVDVARALEASASTALTGLSP